MSNSNASWFRVALSWVELRWVLTICVTIFYPMRVRKALVKIHDLILSICVTILLANSCQNSIDLSLQISHLVRIRLSYLITYTTRSKLSKCAFLISKGIYFGAVFKEIREWFMKKFISFWKISIILQQYLLYV